MARNDPRVDAYIERSAEFARPILKRIRKLFHQGIPQLQETLKWGVPYFEYHGLVGGMAAFKQHVSLGFWKGKLLDDAAGLFSGVGASEMVALKVSRLQELPADDVLLAYIAQAADLNERDIKLPRKPPVREQPIPEDFQAALSCAPQARKTFESLSPSHRREYLEWITDAKRAETRQRRIVQALELLTEGKSKNWKYQQRGR